MNRIVLLGASALALAGCSLAPNAPKPTISPTSVANDVSLVDEALQTELAQLKGVAVPPAAMTALVDLDAVARTVSAQDSLSVQKPQIQRIEDDINAAAAAGAALPGPLQKWLQDAQLVLVPAELAFNILVPSSAVAPARASLAAVAR